MKNTTAVPVLVLGGQENVLSIVRSLGKKGIPVKVSAWADCTALKSRFCIQQYPVLHGTNCLDFWSDLLLSDKHPELHGHVIFSCSDDANEFLIENRQQLQEKYILDDSTSGIQEALLDKRTTLELARAAGVSTPGFWKVDGPEMLDTVISECEFPVMIKPLHSHVFQRAFDGRKFLVVQDGEELRSKVDEVLNKGIQFMISEIIPGSDELLCSYYTYVDGSGKSLYHYTKGVIRRYPVNQGGATYHYTEWMPEVAELGKKFFDSIKFRGIGNIEFKRDVRDGHLKVIECNLRFTAAQELLSRSGMDIAYIIYCHLTGSPVPEIDRYRNGMRLWYPKADFKAFMQLRGRGEITILSWLRSISRPQVFPYFSMTDPWPAISRTLNNVKSTISFRLGNSIGARITSKC